MSKYKQILVACAVAVAGVVGGSIIMSGESLASETPECGANSIIKCGAMTASDLKAKYAANADDLKAIYRHYGITASDIANSGSVKTGYVNPDGTITVGGKVIATDAISVGRTVQSGGTAVKIGGSTVYQGSGRVHSSLSAFIFTDADGNFKAAIIKVCGNPVIAKPVVVKKPVYRCDSLAATIRKSTVSLTTAATAKDGASISKYTYDYGDGSDKDVAGATTTHTYAKAGTYTITVVVTFTVKTGSDTSTKTDSCQKEITIKPVMANACDISTGVYGPVEEDKIDDIHYTLVQEKCTKVRYCDTTTKTYVTVTEADKKASYTTDLSQCLTNVCRVSDKVTLAVSTTELQNNSGSYSEDLSKCTTTTVVELPKTGPADIIGGGLGAGALTVAGYYYFMSRRSV